MKLMWIPPGEFMMGSPKSEEGRDSVEGPQHRVSMGWPMIAIVGSDKHPMTYATPFAIGKYEVTFDQWDACVAGGGCNGYRPEDRGWGRGDRPVINVSWNDAKSYAEWLSRKARKKYRLPSEAEWEFACRAWTQTRWSFGDNEQELPQYGWSVSSSGYRPHAVGELRSNPFGLYDMHGNVWEWCQDWYGANGSEKTVTDPIGSTQGTSRQSRGGSFNFRAHYARSACGSSILPDRRFDISGFRVARTGSGS